MDFVQVCYTNLMVDTNRKFSAGGVVYNAGKVLAIKWISKNWIEFPKGKIETDESKEDTCVREVMEETGYRTKIIQPLGDVTFEFEWADGKYYRKTVYHYLLELADDNEPTPNREENEDYENIWLTTQEASEQLSFDTDKKVLQRAMKFLKP